MTLISFRFLIFVIALLFLYYIFPKKYRWTILLLGSVFYYYISAKKLIIFILMSTTIIYVVGLILTNINKKIKLLNKEENKKEVSKLKRNKKIIVILGILVNISFIIVTKYSGFVIENINNIFKTSITITNILLPLGISYYTLEAISYITDIYRGKYEALKNPFKIALYLLYFPKIIEGPISRFNDINKDLFENNKLDFNSIIIGCDLIVLGLFKKMVIADRAGIFVNNVFGNNYGGITIIFTMILYTIQIYAEFGGCIDIVRGVSMLFNVRLPENFKRPFFSKSIQEFWRLWHITLGNWLKEYVFYPVSLSKTNRKVFEFSKKKFNNYLFRFISAAFPLFFVWIVNGIWHGASYKYLAYGMYYYIIMMIGLLFKPLFDKFLKKIKKDSLVLNFLRIVRTIIIVIIGMTLFRASSINEFFTILSNVFKNGNGILEYGLTNIDFIILIITNLFILIISILCEKNIINIEKGFTNNPLLRSVVYTLLICTIVILGIYGEGYDASNFIYGAF